MCGAATEEGTFGARRGGRFSCIIEWWGSPEDPTRPLNTVMAPGLVGPLDEGGLAEGAAAAGARLGSASWLMSCPAASIAVSSSL